MVQDVPPSTVWALGFGILGCRGYLSVSRDEGLWIRLGLRDGSLCRGV